MATSRHQQGVFNGNFKHENKDGTVSKLSLNPKALDIIWGGSRTKQRYWKQRSEEGADIVELVGLSWLEVGGRVPLKQLTAKTQYKLYFSIKLTPNASGWDKFDVKFRLLLPGEKPIQKHENLSVYKGKSGWQKVPESGIPFTISDARENQELTFTMYEIDSGDRKSGLQLKEVIIEA